MNWLTEHVGEASFRDVHFNKDGDHIYLLSNKGREFFGLALICLSTKKFMWLELGEWDFEYLAMSKDKNREIEYETIEKDGAFFDKIDPLNHTDRIVSPLMVLHGVKDPRVSIEESDQIVNKVK